MEQLSEKRFTLHKGLDTLNIMDNTKFNEHIYINKSSKDMELLVGVLNALHEENMNNWAEITRFKLIVSDIVDDLEKQAKNEEPIVISMDYVDWIKSELDLKLNGLKR